MSINPHMMWKRRAALLGLPLIVWGLILGFALTPFFTKSADPSAQRIDLDLCLAQERCTFSEWRCQEFANLGHPSLQIHAERAITRPLIGGGYEENLQNTRAVFRGIAPTNLLLADCALATYAFSRRHLAAKGVQWWLFPSGMDSESLWLDTEKLPTANLCFGTCREFKVQFQHKSPRFEASGFFAKTPAFALLGRAS